MKGHSSLGYRPYLPLNLYEKTCLPYICRIAPTETEIAIQWLDNGKCENHVLSYRPYLSMDDFKTIAVPEQQRQVIIPNLTPDKDYEFFLARTSNPEEQSDLRLARTGTVPGSIVNYLHPKDPIFDFAGRSLCSPSLVRLPSGKLLSSMDIYSPNYPQNLSLIFQSTDEGDSWEYVSDLFPCFWGKLFVHRDVLYVLGHVTEYGTLFIAKSTDEGQTWSAPISLLPGSNQNTERGPHKAPMPVLETNGRLYTAVDFGAWKKGGHSSGLISIAVDDDLMTAENWVCTGFTDHDERWEGAVKGSSGTLEGNAVVAPDGTICNFLRYVNSETKALVLQADKNDPHAPLTFYKIVPFNGNNSKFDLVYDEKSKAYWTIVSEVVNPREPNQRNVLSLAFSEDMENFTIVKRLLDYRDEDSTMVAFQYVSFLIHEDAIYYLSRTAMNQAKNYHDANYSTFHKIENFRNLKK